jgi:membrane associated rhomboid family serine protease
VIASRLTAVRFSRPQVVSLIVLVGLSILSTLLPVLERALNLALTGLWSGQVWRLVTYVFLARQPLDLIFSCLLWYTLGDLLRGANSMLAYFRLLVGVVAVSGIAVAALSLFFPAATAGALLMGPGVWTTFLWVTVGLQQPTRAMSFWGIQLTGIQFALLGVGFVALQAVYYGLWVAIGELAAAAVAWLFVRGYTPGNLYLRWRSRQLTRQLARSGSKLRSIDGGQSRKRDSYLN